MVARQGDDQTVFMVLAALHRVGVSGCPPTPP
jgi:hypothetical protein